MARNLTNTQLPGWANAAANQTRRGSGKSNEARAWPFFSITSPPPRFLCCGPGHSRPPQAMGFLSMSVWPSLAGCGEGGVSCCIIHWPWDFFGWGGCWGCQTCSKSGQTVVESGQTHFSKQNQGLSEVVGKSGRKWSNVVKRWTNVVKRWTNGKSGGNLAGLGGSNKPKQEEAVGVVGEVSENRPEYHKMFVKY